MPSREKINDVYEWFKINSIKLIDLIKVNIEGGEYELLDRMIEAGLMSKVSSLSSREKIAQSGNRTTQNIF